MPHAIQIRQTGAPEVLDWTAVDVGEPGSGQAKAELAHAHGCSHTILYTKQDFVAEVSRISGGEKLPVVLDSVRKDTFLRSLDCPRPRRLMVAFGQASDPIAPIPLPIHGATRCDRSFRERAVRRSGFGKGAH